MKDEPVQWILSVHAADDGVSEQITVQLSGLCPWPPVEMETPGQQGVWIEAYFDSETEARLALSSLENLTQSPLNGSVRPCPRKDWTTFWRHHFHPRRLDGRY